MTKARKMVSYDRLSEEVVEQINRRFPYGVDESDLLEIRKNGDDVLKVLQFETTDAIYLVKIPKDVNDVKLDLKDYDMKTEEIELDPEEE